MSEFSLVAAAVYALAPKSSARHWLSFLGSDGDTEAQRDSLETVSRVFGFLLMLGGFRLAEWLFG